MDPELNGWAVTGEFPSRYVAWPNNYVGGPVKNPPKPINWEQLEYEATPIKDTRAVLIEALMEEVAKIREELAGKVDDGSLTKEQAAALMHQAFIAGIEWALDNIPELADRLGYLLPNIQKQAQPSIQVRGYNSSRPMMFNVTFTSTDANT